MAGRRFSQKTNGWIWIVRVKGKTAHKTNSSVRLLGESMARQSAFEFNWRLYFWPWKSLWGSPILGKMNQTTLPQDDKLNWKKPFECVKKVWISGVFRCRENCAIVLINFSLVEIWYIFFFFQAHLSESSFLFAFLMWRASQWHKKCLLPPAWFWTASVPFLFGWFLSD